MSGRLEAIDVGLDYRSGMLGGRVKRALAATSLAIGGAAPEIVAVVGESGSGKTTLTRLLLGFQRPTAGRVTYRGVDLAAMDAAARHRFRREVQAVFQDPFEAFNPFYRVDHALFTPLARFGIASRRGAAAPLVEAALAAVGLRPGETLGRYPHQLSGGQRQRVMIARALLLRPSIILADEPVSMVDASLRSTILQALLKLRDEAGISLVYVTHDLTTAYQIADTVVVLYEGRIVERGDAERVIRAPRHPYTRMLIDAIPSPDPDRSWGLDLPEPRAAEDAARAAPPSGCAFAPRCAWRRPDCDRAMPALRALEDGRALRCLRDDVADAAAPS
jgi:oligopeptide/dipeptide ABC transporter ATP-binding protein